MYQGSIKIGSMVLIKEDNVPPSRYGVYMHPGSKCCFKSGHIVKRAVSKISVLPVTNEDISD